MHFDWYAATIPVVSDHLISALGGAFGPSVQMTEGRGLHGYKGKVDVISDGRPACHVLYGGLNGAPHAWASGEETAAFVAVVRKLFPRHNVSRFDSASDFDEPGVFRRLAKLVISFGTRLDLKIHHVGDWQRGVDGRTLYLGSRKSDVFVRLYEKGKQVRVVTDGDGQVRDASPDWVRLEVQVRPQREARARAATSSPEGAWGFSRWTRELASEVSGLNVEQVVMQSRRPLPYRESFNAMLAQYHSVLLAVLQHDCSDNPDELGQKIASVIRSEQQARDGRRRLAS